MLDYIQFFKLDYLKKNQFYQFIPLAGLYYVNLESNETRTGSPLSTASYSRRVVQALLNLNRDP